MIDDNGKKYRDLPHLTEGDEAFRKKFLSWDIGDLCMTDIREYLQEKDLVLVPMASLEQHGPHLPLYTDTVTAWEISKRIAEMIAVLHTPPVWMGYSPQHMHEPGEGRGTITLRAPTLLNLIYDVGRSLIHHGFNRIIFINGHKGTNNPALITACRSVHQYELPDVLLALVDPMYIGKGAAPIKDAVEHHAGELEISHVWHKFPHLIRQQKLPAEHIDLEPIFSPFVHKDLFGAGGDTIEIFWSSK